MRTADASITNSAKAAFTPVNRVSGRWWCPARTIFPAAPKSAGIRAQNGRRNRLLRLFRVGTVDFPCGAEGGFYIGKRSDFHL